MEGYKDNQALERCIGKQLKLHIYERKTEMKKENKVYIENCKADWPKDTWKKQQTELKPTNGNQIRVNEEMFHDHEKEGNERQKQFIEATHHYQQALNQEMAWYKGIISGFHKECSVETEAHQW